MKPAEIRAWQRSAKVALRIESNPKLRAMLTSVVALWEIAEQLAVLNSSRQRKNK